jgi:hypothetical protein
LRHIDELAETVLGIGCGEGFHGWRLAELANLGKHDLGKPASFPASKPRHNVAEHNEISSTKCRCMI